MARVRSVTPAFFRHELLQDLEAAHPGAHVMLVFAGLWTVADKEGRFEWRPRQLHLDILPFLALDLEKTLTILTAAGFIRRYTVGDRVFGFIPNFGKYQRISGKEAQGPARFPAPPETDQVEPENHPGSAGEAPEKQPGAPITVIRSTEYGEKTSSSCAEPSADAEAPAPDPDCPVFPCAGPGKHWRATLEQRGRWHAGYPTLDIPTEYRRAAAWLADNPTKRKTARGMPKFIGGWLARAQNTGPRQLALGPTPVSKAGVSPDLWNQQEDAR